MMSFAVHLGEGGGFLLGQAVQQTARALACLISLGLLVGGCSKEEARRKRVGDDEDGDRRTSEAADPFTTKDPVFTKDEDAAALPASVLSYRRFATRYYANASAGFRDPETPEAAWSKMARDFCGGDDIYASIVNSGVWKSTGKGIGRAIRNLEKTREAIVCGKTVAAALGPRVERLQVRTPGEPDDLRLASPASVTVSRRELSLDPVPLTSRLVALESVPAFEKAVCLPIGSDPDCNKPSSSMIGKLPEERSWITGAPLTVRALGAALADRSRAPHPRAKQLLSLARTVASFQAAEVGVAPGFNLGFVSGLGVRGEAVKNVDKLPFSQALQKALLQRSVTYAFGDRVNPYGGDMRVVFQPEDESQVDALMSDLRAWRTAILEHLRPYQPTALMEGMLPLESTYQNLIHTWAVRSIEEAKIARDGVTVVLEFERRLTPDERATVEEMHALNTKRAQRGAEMMRLLLDGKEPPASLFEGIGAESFAADVEKERAGKSPN